MSAMRMTCRNCEQQFMGPSLPAGSKPQCPNCGAVLLPVESASLPRKHSPVAYPHHHHHGQGRDAAAKRIFEPIPRTVLYAIGILLMIGLLAPFWLSPVSERFKQRSPEEEMAYQEVELPPKRPPIQNAAHGRSSLPSQVQPAAAPALDRYGPIHLDMNWSEIHGRYALSLVNTLGMQPAIYESHNVADVEKATFYFYNRVLKECYLAYGEQRVIPLRLVRRLQERFGEPVDWVDESVEPMGLGLDLDPDEEKTTFLYRQRMTWFDGNHQLVATIDFSSKEPALCISRLTIHMTALKWIETHRSLLLTDRSLQFEESNGGAPPVQQDSPPGIFPLAR